jgi:hypothetical protein
LAFLLTAVQEAFLLTIRPEVVEGPQLGPKMASMVLVAVAEDQAQSYQSARVRQAVFCQYTCLTVQSMDPALAAEVVVPLPQMQTTPEAQVVYMVAVVAQVAD